ncbi:MAG: hypothetical protein WAM85_00710 [Terracidiphilus sp.]
MPVLTQRLEAGPAFAILRAIRAPLKIPAWSVVALVAFAGLYGFASGRQMPRHHYVPYVGYPLVLDTTTGKACYATKPKPIDDALSQEAGYPVDSDGNRVDTDATGDLSIPMCAK